MSDKIGGCSCAGCADTYKVQGPDGTIYTESVIGATGVYTGETIWPRFAETNPWLIEFDRAWNAGYGQQLSVLDKFIGDTNTNFGRGSYFVKYCGGAFSTNYLGFNQRWFVAGHDGGQMLVQWNPIAAESEAQYQTIPLQNADNPNEFRSLHGFNFAYVAQSASSKSEAIANAACLLKPFYHAGGPLAFAVPYPASDWPVPRESPANDWPQWKIYQAKPLLFAGYVTSLHPGIVEDATRYDIQFRVYSLSRGRWWAKAQIDGDSITSVDQPPQSTWWARDQQHVILRYLHSSTPAHTVWMSLDDESGGSTKMPGVFGSVAPRIEWNLTPILKVVEVTNATGQPSPFRLRVIIKVVNLGLGPTTIPLRFTFENTDNVTWDDPVKEYQYARLGGLYNPSNYAFVSSNQDPQIGGFLSRGLQFISGMFAVPGGSAFSGTMKIRASISNGSVNYGTFESNVNYP